MGSTSQTGREREGEMFLIVLLLISTALGSSGSAQVDVGEGIADILNSIVHFTNETGSLLGALMIRTSSEGLQAAELNILQLEAELNILHAQVPALRNYVSGWNYSGNYSAPLNEAKSYLQQARQELRDLAETAVKEIRDVIELLEDHNINNDPILLKLAIDIIKDLILETKERLEEARGKYSKVTSAFTDLSAEVNKLKASRRVSLAIIRKFEESRGYLADFKTKLERTNINNLIEDIDVAKELIDVYLDDIIGDFADYVIYDIEDYPIEDYPAEYLEKCESIREAFKTGLVDLKNVAEQFLVDRTSSRLLGTNHQDLRFAEQNMLKMSMELNGAARYSAAVNKATSNLRQTRQELRELAVRTVTEGRNLAVLLDALPGYGTLDALLRSFLDTMKDLRFKTEEKLDRAREIYQSADEALRDLKGRLLILDEDRMLGRTTILIRDIDDARVVIDEEIEQIIKWNDNNDNIGQFPTEVLANNQADRDEFKSELVEMINIAENYLVHTE